MPWKFITLDSEAGQSPERETFNEAFRDMYQYVRKLLDAGQLSLQVLETAIYIDTPTKVPLFFYEARDRACETGLMEILLNEK
jgi:hypothetical protein